MGGAVDVCADTYTYPSNRIVKRNEIIFIFSRKSEKMLNQEKQMSNISHFFVQ